MRIQAIVLAAGLSSRFEGNKLLAELAGQPVIVRTLRNLTSQENVDKIVVVTGYMREEVEETIGRFFEEELSSGRIVFVFNPMYKEGGMSSSVKRGLEEIDRHAHVMILPGDVACLRKSTIQRLIEEHILRGHLITVACYGDKHGHPVIFSYLLRGELEQIDEESMGLKKVIRIYKGDIYCLDTGDEGTIVDIDTIDELKICEELVKKD